MNYRVAVAAVFSTLLVALSGVALGDDGEKVFKKCAVCHKIGEGAKNGVGPVLNGLEGRHSGTIEGFKYSAANKNSGIVWDEAQFKEYIQNPRAKIPGTTMVFVGLKKQEEIDALWDYLKSFGPDGKQK